MTERQTRRQIGRWGTAARALVGTGFLVAAGVMGPTLGDAVLGFVVMPGIVVGILAIRGQSATPLRLDGPFAHVANIAIAIGLLGVRVQVGSVLDVRTAALLFYGASMLLAAWRGMGACELFAISNALRQRDDRLGCPLFLPIDSVEAARSARP
jgi:hypothetical protein